MKTKWRKEKLHQLIEELAPKLTLKEKNELIGMLEGIIYQKESHENEQ